MGAFAASASAGAGCRLRRRKAFALPAYPGSPSHRFGPRYIASARAAVPNAELIQADIENHPWPLVDALGTRQFDAVIVCNYLWRPLWPALLASVAEGGVLIYETFAVGQERFGRPRRPEFLLQAGELLEACKSLQVLGYECGIDSEPPRALQRIAAVRDSSLGSTGATRSLK